MIRFAPGVLIFVLWLYCLIDVITSPPGGARHLSKNLWLLIVFLFPLLGSIAWLLVGRPVAERPLTREQGAAPTFPEYERRGRFASTDPEKDEDFLRKVRERAEEQRREYDARVRAEREAEEAERKRRKQLSGDADPDPAD